MSGNKSECPECGMITDYPWCKHAKREHEAEKLVRSTASAMFLRNLKADMARDSRDILCAAEGGDLNRMARLLATADRDTLALALWVYAAKSAEAAR